MALNHVLANSTQCNINMLQKSIELAELTTDLEIRDMYGDLKITKDALKEFKEQYKSFTQAANMAKLQVKSFRMFGIGDINIIDESQSN